MFRVQSSEFRVRGSLIARAASAAILLASFAPAQLSDGHHALTDTLNASSGAATASTSNLGIKLLKVEYTKTNTNPPTTYVVQLAWNGTEYVDNNEAPTKRFYWVTVAGVTYYWFDRLDASGDAPGWVTDSSGTMP